MASNILKPLRMYTIHVRMFSIQFCQSWQNTAGPIGLLTFLILFFKWFMEVLDEKINLQNAPEQENFRIVNL